MQVTHAIDRRESHVRDMDVSHENANQANECTVLRNECLRQLRSLMARTSMYTVTDFALEERGVDHFTQTLQREELKKSLQFIPRTSERLIQAEQSFRRDIAGAMDRGWLTPHTAQHWIKKLHSSKYTWSEKVRFIENTFPRLLANWQRLSEDITKVKKRVEGNPDLLATPEIKAVLGKGGNMRGYKEWRAAIDLAAAKIAVHGDSKRTELLHIAQMRLETALRMRATTPQKANLWLKRIFESNAKPDAIEKFVNGKLGQLTANWIEEKKRYDEVENQRKKLGTPRSFHFVPLHVFLGYSYDQKWSYNDVAAKSIERMQHSHPVIMELKREVAAKDWATVEHLITEAGRTDLSDKDVWELNSIKKFISFHRPRKKTPEEDAESKTETREDVERDLQETLSELHPTLAGLTSTMIRNETYDTVRAYLAAAYNFGWSHKHLYLNHDVLEKLREGSKDETEYVQQHGDLGDERMENLDIDSLDEKHMDALTNRKYGEGTEAPMYVHVSQQNHDSFRRMCRQNACNERWKYWVIVDFKEVPYRDQLHLATQMRHKIKSIKRRWDKTAPTARPTPKKKMPKNASSFATAG